MAWYDKEHGRFEYTVRGFDKLVLANDKLKPAVTRAALRIANMVRDRVDKQGKDHKGQKLPQVTRRTGWYWTGAYDPRFYGKAEWDQFQPYKGGDVALVYWRGYRALKGKMNGGRTWRGASLTGEMWKNMDIQVRPGTMGFDSFVIDVKFRKSQRVGLHKTKKTKSGKAKVVSVRNRTKAEMLQYRRRTSRGKPYDQAFVLMQPSDGEVGIMLQLISAGIQFANR